MTDDAPELSERQYEFLDLLPASTSEIADVMDVEPSTVEYHREVVREKGYDLAYDRDTNTWRQVCDTPVRAPDSPDLPDLSDVDPDDPDPDPSDLTDREEFIARELQTGATLAELSDALDERESVVTQHLRDLKQRGWRVYIDESAEHIAIEGDHALRSSEHKGTRTRKANRWWELRHNELVRKFRTLERPTTSIDAYDGNEDWVTHITDLHAGDRVRRDDGTVVYETDAIPDVIDYISDRSLALADKHGSVYDTAHLLWGGDMVTNEGIYEGQFENLDAWLDEQHDVLVAPLLRQLKAFADRFLSVQVVCQVGNHGRHRASGTSKQANADLVLYKHLRNTVAEIRKATDGETLGNVQFLIGEAKPYRNFELRGGKLTGHLRHGQDRRPQAETSARSNEWRGTLMEHDFDVAALGHHHISGRIPWSGPPIICTGSPKPAGEFVERLGGRPDAGPDGRQYRDIATVFGVSDDGVTAVFPVDTRYYDR